MAYGKETVVLEVKVSYVYFLKMVTKAWARGRRADCQTVLEIWAPKEPCS